jgi:hypothetical protein
MNSTNNEQHVLPRPIESLPEYARADARKNLADKLVTAFQLSEASAMVIANAVVDPSEVRRAIGDPAEPEYEKIPVPGGTLTGIRTTVWSRRIMPDPRNPRTLPARRHPFAVEPGTGGEESKFRPVPEPRALDPEHRQNAELAVDIESRDHLTWASQQAARYVLAENNWRESIASQGVMEAVWLAATTYVHNDGSAAATTLVTAEGSSRMTAVHELLGIRSADVLYDDNEAGLRARIKKLNQLHELGADEDSDTIALRVEMVPALILVGFTPYPNGRTEFSTAVKSLVALRHVDPPKSWGEGPENESLADEVLDELYRRDLISANQRAYFAGSCTQAEAASAHLPSDPILRAAQIVNLFTNKDERIQVAIRVAVTSQSTRKRITSKLMNELATALILRSVADDPGKVDQVRRYLRHAFGKSVHRGDWASTGRSTDQLVADALDEVREWIGAKNGDEPGPASLELAVRASYPLVVSGRLNADRGSAGNEQPDRRTPGEVLDTMRRSLQGVRQLGQTLKDFAKKIPISAVDEAGNLKTKADGLEVQPVNDIYLRREFPPPGRAKASRPGDTPEDHYNNAVAALGSAIDSIQRAFIALTHTLGDDGSPLAEQRGVEIRLIDPWRGILKHIDEEMVVWASTYRKKTGTKNVVLLDLDQIEDEDEADPYAEADSEIEQNQGSNITP